MSIEEFFYTHDMDGLLEAAERVVSYGAPTDLTPNERSALESLSQDVVEYFRFVEALREKYDVEYS